MIPHSKICVTQNFSPTNSECQRKCFSKVGCGIVNVDLLAFDTTWTVNIGISKEGETAVEEFNCKIRKGILPERVDYNIRKERDP